MDGGYDAGYRYSPCFWGKEPGSLVKMLCQRVHNWNDLKVLDAGCGEGKNSVYLAGKGATVHAFDISEAAIANAKASWSEAANIVWKVRDARKMDFGHEYYDVVIAYGLLHCLGGEGEVCDVAQHLKAAVKPGGYCIVCSFNDRSQDLSAHPGFNPCLISHRGYVGIFSGWEIIHGTDENLTEIHPHNGIVHTHSMTRLIARKGGP
jgi:cyclopropane fatty-acyl-phospholipid synthase-like methyltransferase